MGKKFTVAWIGTTLVALMMIGSMFVPFAAKKPISFSMFDMMQEYFKYTSAVSIIGSTLIIIFGCAVILCAIFALAKKPVVVIVFSVIAMIDYGIMIFDLVDRRAVGSKGLLDFTFIMYALFVLGALLFVGAIVMTVEKHKAKKKIASNEGNGVV